MKVLDSKFFNFLFDLVSFFSLGLALPIGFRHGFCYIFGWSEISQRAGLVLGMIIGFLLFLVIIKRMDDEYSCNETAKELRKYERRYYEKSAELKRACEFLTSEQKQIVFSSEKSTIDDSSLLIDTPTHLKSISLHYCYIVTVSLIISILFFVLFSSSDPLIRTHSEQKFAQSAESSVSFSHAADDISMYWGSKKSDIIHKASCRHAKKISKENRVYYRSVENAEKDGRTPCSVCLGE